MRGTNFALTRLCSKHLLKCVGLSRTRCWDHRLFLEWLIFCLSESFPSLSKRQRGIHRFYKLWCTLRAVDCNVTIAPDSTVRTPAAWSTERQLFSFHVLVIEMRVCRLVFCTGDLEHILVVLYKGKETLNTRAISATKGVFSTKITRVVPLLVDWICKLSTHSCEDSLATRPEYSTPEIPHAIHCFVFVHPSHDIWVVMKQLTMTEGNLRIQR
jgi:hypothetical protein